jgi:serine protease Do
MKKYFLSAAILTALNLTLLGTAYSQDSDKSSDKEKSRSKMSDYEEIIIKKKADKDAKVTVEIKDGEVKVDGKPIDDYESEALSVRRRKPPVITYSTPASPFRGGTWNLNDDNRSFGRVSSNTAFLGIATEETSSGARIQQVTEESAAEKAGLKKGDVITKIDDKTVTNQREVSEVIRKHKPDDKITITYMRDGKENKTTATLGKSKNTIVQGYGAFPDAIAPLEKLRELENFNFDHNVPGQAFSFSAKPRIGIRAQDTDDSKGAKVLDVAEESAAAKAGIKEDDIITSFNGKNITNADELSAAARESKDKSSIEVKLNRSGKTQTVQIKIPKKLKTTSL